MNIWLLALISIVFLSASGQSFLNYAFSMTGLNLNMFTAFTNFGMTLLFGIFMCGLFSVIALWKPWNKFYTPVWLIMGFGTCYVIANLMNGTTDGKDFILIPLVSILTIAYYLWCQKRH